MLNKKQIEALIRDKELISEFINLEKQMTPNGFDITVGEVSEFSASGALDFSNSERTIPEGKKILPQN